MALVTGLVVTNSASTELSVTRGNPMITTTSSGGTFAGTETHYLVSDFILLCVLTVSVSISNGVGYSFLYSRAGHNPHRVAPRRTDIASQHHWYITCSAR